MTYLKWGWVVAALVILLSLAFSSDIPRGISYQGKLYEGGGPASGIYDFQVALYDSASGGTELWVESFEDVSVSYGLFSLVLDNSDGGTNIGDVLVQHRDLWVEVRVRPGSSTGSYTVLGSREKLQASPWAITIADRSVSESKIDWGTGTGQVSADDVPFQADDAGWGASPPGDVDAGLEDLVNRVSALESGSGNYVQLSPGSAQGDADATSSIWIDKTAASGNLMELEVGGIDEFVVDHSGNVSLGGDLRVSGNDIYGQVGGSSNLYIRSDHGVRIDLDDDSDGSATFGIRNGGDNVVFEVTEGGNVSADGSADFNGNLTLSGSSGRSINGPTDASLSVISETNLNLYIDGDDATGSVNASALRVYRDQPGGETEIFKVTEGGNVTVYGDINFADGVNTGTLTASLSGDRTWTLPDASGTIALTSDIVDNYASGVSFDDGTNVLTITRTGGLSDLTATIPVENDDLSDNQLTDLSDVNTSGAVAGSVLKYDGSQWVAGTDNEGISGSGSAGQVAYFTGASTVGGMNSLYWDYTNERLGLGTNSPMYRLDVRYTGEKVLRLGSETGNDLTIDIAAGAGLANIVAGATYDADSGRYEYTGTRGASRIRLHDGQITLLVGGTSGSAGNPVSFTTGIDINSAGNVGIKGGASSGDALYVYGSGHFTGSLTIGSYTLPSSDGVSGQVLMTDGAGNVSWGNVSGDNWGSQVVQHDGTLSGDGTSGSPLSVVDVPGGDNDYIQNRSVDGSFGSGQSASFDITGGGEIGGNLAVSGNVGIGVVSGGAKLEVVGSSNPILYIRQSASNSADGGIKIRGSRNACTSCDVAYIDLSDYDDNETGGPIDFVMARIAGGMNDVSGGTGYLKFYTNDGSGLLERMRIDKNGNVGIGTSSPAGLLDVAGNSVIRGQLDMSSNRIVNVSNPVNGQDAATKSYVDGVAPQDDLSDNVLNDLSDVNASAPSSGQVLTWDGSAWVPQDPSGGINGSGTTNYLPKWTASTTLGNSQIYDNGSNVGIGTTTPAWKFDVRNTGDFVAHFGDNGGDDFTIDIAGGQGLVNLVAGAKVTSGTNDYEFTGSRGASRIEMHDGSMYFYTSTVTSGTAGSTVSWNTVMSMDNAGKVGIGITSPAVKLHITGGTDVVGSTANTGYMIIGNASGQHLAFDDNEIQSKTSGTTVGALYVQTDGGDFVLHNNVSDNSHKFMVKDDGSVGVGTTSPTQKLHVVGNALVEDSTYFGDTDAYIYQDGSDNLMFRDPNANGGAAISLSELAGAGGQGGDMGRTMNSNWNFEDGTKHWANWSGTGTVVTVTDGIMGSRAWQNSAASVTNWMYSEEMIPIDPNKQYVVEVYARTVSGTVGRFYLAVLLRDADGNNISGDGTWWYYPVNVNDVPTSWTRYQGVFGYGTAKPFPSNARYMQIGAILNYDYGSGHDRIQQIQGLRVYEVNNEFLVVNPRSSAPGTAPEGMVYYDSDDHKMYYYNGSAWVDMSGGGASVWQDAGTYIYPSTASSFHIEDDGDLDMGGHNIERVNEISANNIDPVLKIGGKLYRTWTLDMVGQRTEVVGQAKLNSDGVWMVDLATQPEASDLWLFWHAVDQKTIIPFVTPQGPVQLYAYVEGSKFFVKSIDGTGNVKFSYRLIGVRYDFRDMTPEETNVRTKPTDTYIDIDAGQRYGE